MNYLLDTNIALIYIRKSGLYEKLEREFNLFAADNRLVVSIVTVGELKSIALRNKWGVKKIKKLIDILEQFLVADINAELVVERYAEIDAFSQGKLGDQKSSFTSRNMGKNDIWIAATASVLDIPLLTTDNDFDHLSDFYIKLTKVDISKSL